MSFHLFKRRHKHVKAEPLISSRAIQRKSNSGQQTLNSDKSEPSAQKQQSLQSVISNQVDNINLPSVVEEVISSEGKTLDANTRASMGSRFGHDFSQVRVHTDAKAAESSEAVNARAYTVGNHIVFNASEYKPGTLVGDALIGHELAHVVQQQGASYSSEPMQKGEAEQSTLEEDADISAVGTVASLWGMAKGVFTNVAKNAMPRLRTGLKLQRCTREQEEQAKAFFRGAVSGLTSGRRQPIPIPMPDPDAARGMMELQYGINREDFIMWQAGLGHSPRWESFYGRNFIDWSAYLRYGDSFADIWPHFLRDAHNGTIPREAESSGRGEAGGRSP